jgi:hypothetical protein
VTSFIRPALYVIPMALTFAACGGDETQSTEDHTPVTYQLMVDGVGVPAPYTFAADQTSRVRIKFFNQAQHDLDDVEGEHFGGLTFNPTSLATVSRVAGHNYQFDVTGQSPGTGILRVSFGHDVRADEESFPNAAVTVTGGGEAP